MLIQITSGRGPNECELAVGLFLSSLKSELGELEILAEEKGRYNGTFKSILVKISENTSLCGTIQCVFKSPYRPNHKRKNWFIGIKQIDEPNGSIYETAVGGIVYQTYRSGGKGGQHINKTESAVRAIHTATGLSAISQDERSQHLNKKIALERLQKMLTGIKDEIDLFSQHELNHNHNLLARGNPIRIYEGTAFKRTF
ncbi:MAG: peptide chain release factor H [Defluviitaleaceae bacterium]|nr:peptide chain release factor H [Defluviitaleaceae bacterium]